MKKMKMSLWDEAAKSLKAAIPKEEYDRVFSKVQLVSFQDGTAVLSVGSSHTEDYLRDRYLDTLENNSVAFPDSLSR